MELKRELALSFGDAEAVSYSAKSSDNAELLEAYISRLRREVEAGRTVCSRFSSASPKGTAPGVAIVATASELPMSEEAAAD